MMMKLFTLTLKRELIIAVRNKSDWVMPALFSILMISLFPLGVSPLSDELSKMSSGIIWVAALLSTLLAFDRLFKQDLADGTLEMLATSGQPLSVIVFAKVIAHWLITGLPLVLLSPLYAVMMYLPDGTFGVLFIGLLSGTITMSFVGAMGAGLTVGIRKGGGTLLAMILLPLYMPILIFGTAAINNAAIGLPYRGQLAILFAGLIFAVVVTPVVTAMTVRLSLENS